MDDFLPIGGIRTRSELRWIRDGYFFSLTGNRYFTTAMILYCEQVEIYSFCDINYDLFLIVELCYSVILNIC
jgi:hypothetical protein